MTEQVFLNFSWMLSFTFVLTVVNSMFLWSFMQQVLLLENELKKLRAELRATATKQDASS